MRREVQNVGQFGHSLHHDERRHEFGPVSFFSSKMSTFWTKNNLYFLLSLCKTIEQRAQKTVFIKTIFYCEMFGLCNKSFVHRAAVRC